METMKFQKTKEHLFLGQYFCLHLSGPIEQIYIHNEMSYVFNLGLITPLHTIVYLCFASFLGFHNIHEYANEISFIWDHRMKELIKLLH